MKSKTLYLAGGLLLTLGALPLAASVSIPHTFQAGDTARAGEVNANFTALRDELNNALTRIADLEVELAEYRKFHEHVEVIPDPNILNEYTVRFTGVNVQIVNGLESTRTINGLGNLIVGYNEARPETEPFFMTSIDVPEVCDDGRYANEQDCVANGGAWEWNHKNGSHNIVGGTRNSYSSHGGFVVGQSNAINRPGATVSGGWINVASGWHSTVSAGRGNQASGSEASVTGGLSNTAGGMGDSVSGGLDNTAVGVASSVSGGRDNTADGVHSSVSGGRNNTASGQQSSILGGDGESIASDGGQETIPSVD